MNALGPFADTYADVPDRMKSAPRWLVWKAEPRDEGKKPAKVPYYTDGGRRSGRLDCQADWDRLVTFDEALAAALRSGGYTGLGFALGPDGTGACWQGIDLDNVTDHPGLEFVVDELPGYTDESPSGRGRHAIGYGRPFATLGSNGTGIEAYAAGRFFTVTGSKVGLGEITCLADFVASHLARLHSQRDPPAAPSMHAAAAPTMGALAASLVAAKLRDALRLIPSDDRDVWIKVGLGLKLLGDTGEALWLEWSKTSEKFDAEDARRVWLSFKPVGIDHRAIFNEARRRGWNGPTKAEGASPDGPANTAPEASEDALAQEFATRHARDLRYVPFWGRWMIFNDQRWIADDTLYALDEARHISTAAACQAAKPHEANRLASANTASAVERLARADRRLAASIDIWDADPWMLNTPGGVVDLRTGAVGPNDPRHYLTKMTSVPPSGDCPLWLAFIERITDGNGALATFLQRMLGYMLTGDTSLQFLFFAYGTGANGKSVLISTVARIIDDYHRAASIETFTATNTDRHPTELAYLRGSRLVSCIETEQGRRWQESRIKALTGGDKISARFMRQDFFEFTPQFKLLIAGNHKPGLRSVDEAIRRRLILIPFTVTIPPEERDVHLLDKLWAEGPGILSWMIQGCLDWQREGLVIPDCVREATEAYLDGEDAIAAWIVDCCDADETAAVPTSKLYGSWKGWAEGAGEYVGSEKAFAQALDARKLVRVRTSKFRGFRGLRLRSTRE